MKYTILGLCVRTDTFTQITDDVCEACGALIPDAFKAPNDDDHKLSFAPGEMEERLLEMGYVSMGLPDDSLPPTDRRGQLRLVEKDEVEEGSEFTN